MSESAAPTAGSPAPGRPGRRVLLLTGLLVVAATILLEVWRPFFYLTDDNFTSFMPGIAEFSQKLWSGRNPLINDHIFGGNYRLLADPSVFGVFSPWLPIVSVAGATPAYLWTAELMSLCNSLAIALAFAWSALWLRRHFELEAPDWLIVGLSLSYTFTPFNLLLGSSWVGFLNGQASLPLIVVGFFHPSTRRAILLQAGALLYALFGGHAHTFLIVCLFSGLLALAVSARIRSAAPALRLIAAAGVAAIFILPILLPAVTEFQGSPRGAGLTVEAASVSRIPAFQLVTTFLLGPVMSLFAGGLFMHGADRVYNLSAAFSLFSLPFVTALGIGLFRRRLHPLAGPLLLLFVLGALLVARPAWLGQLVAHVPLLKSLQWPFREIWLLHFAAHVFVLLHFRELRGLPGLLAGAVAGVFFSGVFFNVPPTLYLFELDRQLVLNGEAERHWAGVLRRTGPAPRIVLGVNPRHIYYGRESIPWALIGGYNFGSIFGYVSESGYTFTSSLRADPGPADARPYFFAGCYTPPDARKLAASRPGVWLIELDRIDPSPEWTISRGDVRLRFRLDAETQTVSELPPRTTPPVPPAETGPVPTPVPRTE